jgi:hypothetical protein
VCILDCRARWVTGAFRLPDGGDDMRRQNARVSGVEKKRRDRETLKAFEKVAADMPTPTLRRDYRCVRCLPVRDVIEAELAKRGELR